MSQLKPIGSLKAWIFFGGMSLHGPQTPSIAARIPKTLQPRSPNSATVRRARDITKMSGSETVHVMAPRMRFCREKKSGRKWNEREEGRTEEERTCLIRGVEKQSLGRIFVSSEGNKCNSRERDVTTVGKQGRGHLIAWSLFSLLFLCYFLPHQWRLLPPCDLIDTRITHQYFHLTSLRAQ